MANKMDDYILCTDECSLDDAISKIRLSPVVFLDCEGLKLGQQGGTLSLISLRVVAPGTPQTYLIDTIALTSKQLAPLLDIISSPSPTKIVFDGRMDFSELYHGFGISISNVLDLQLADIQSRGQRGEDDEKQLRRLSPYLHHREISGQRGSYTAVHKLNGLEKCAKEHKVINDDSSENRIDHWSWLRRPLPDNYLRYASRDVYLIGLLYAHFNEGGYLNSQLFAQSARYVSLWREARPKNGDGFKQHALLPLQILEVNSDSMKKTCVGCQRDLPASGYSRAAWNGVTKQRCWVCRAISVRTEMHNNWDREDDCYDDYDDDSDGMDGGYGSGGSFYDSDDYGCGWSD